MTVEQRGIEPLPVNAHVYNNTFYSNSSGGFRPIQFAQGAGRSGDPAQRLQAPAQALCNPSVR